MAATDADCPIRLLHLRDIHFRVGTAWDTDPVLRDLVCFIVKKAVAELASDLVTITSDLAFAGRADDASARDRLDCALWSAQPSDPSAPWPSDRLLLVPDNDDVDGDAVNDMAGMVQDGLLARTVQDRIAAVLGQPGQLEVLPGKSVGTITGEAKKTGVKSLFQRDRTVRTNDSFCGMHDFKVIAYLIVLESGAT